MSASDASTAGPPPSTASAADGPPATMAGAGPIAQTRAGGPVAQTRGAGPVPATASKSSASAAPDAAVASGITVAAGLGMNAQGWLERFTVDIANPNGKSYLRGTDWGHISDAAYGSTPSPPGAPTYVASGDIDGDGRDEVVVGTGPSGEGKVYVFRNTLGSYQQAYVLQLSGFPGYTSSPDARTYPACVDIDGDGRAEIVIGTGPAGAGWAQIWKYNPGTDSFAPMAGTPNSSGYIQVGWPEYCSSGKAEVHPAGGYLGGRGAGRGQQLVLGLGAAGGGWMQILTWNGSALVPYSMSTSASGWMQVDWPSYNSGADASTWPACGDLDGDGFDDLVVGLGDAGQGWFETFRSVGGNPSKNGWLQVDWVGYNTSGRAGVRPSVGDIDGDGKADIVCGLAGSSAAGWIYVLRSGTGSWSGSWTQILWDGYNQSGNAPTYAAIVHGLPASTTPSPSPSPSPSASPTALDTQLRSELSAANITPLAPAPTVSAERQALGQALFFDKILSGRKSTNCASCHDPNTSLGTPFSLGVGLRGFLPRRTPHLFMRGSADFTAQFWDSRVASNGDGTFRSPAGNQLPAGINSASAAQDLFPMMATDEMRGLAGETDVNGQPNELGNIPDGQFANVWNAIMTRLRGVPQYMQMFRAAYPGVPDADFTMAHAANAIADYEVTTLRFDDTPFDRYLAGNNGAMTDSQKRGAVLFYGKARCLECHAGNLMTDQASHNIGSPQLGPGRPAESPLDFGLGETTNIASDRFLFRTPPLRNAGVNAAFFHDGPYTRVADAVSHHLSATTSLQNYDPVAAGIDPRLQSQVRNDPDTINAILSTLDARMQSPPSLTSAELADLVEFLTNGLTDPKARDTTFLFPATVPSGLPVR